MTELRNKAGKNDVQNQYDETMSYLHHKYWTKSDVHHRTTMMDLSWQTRVKGNKLLIALTSEMVVNEYLIALSKYQLKSKKSNDVSSKVTPS